MNIDLILLGFLIEAALFITGLAKIYTSMEVRFIEFEVRITNLENQENEISKKLDSIIESIHEIKLNLKDKQDRP